MKNAALFDSNRQRRGELARNLIDSGWSCLTKDRVYDPGSYDFYELNDATLVLLHLRGPNNQCGDARSWGYFQDKILQRLKERKAALIAYTGGDKNECAEPEEFKVLREGVCNGWCVYLNDIKGQRDLNLRDFALTWQDQTAAPPLDILVARALPQATLAAYLLSRVGKLEQAEFAGIRKLADMESQGDYSAKIDAYFGFEDARVLRATEFGILALSLRAKVSHSWLDHEVLSVAEDVAVARWKSGSWRNIAERWHTLYALALDFGVALPELSASTLVDRLDVFKRVPQESRETLKQRLDLLMERGGACQGKAKYVERLDSFWQSAQTYFALAEDAAANDQAVRAAWREVRERGEALKSLFHDGTIPDGVVVP